MNQVRMCLLLVAVLATAAQAEMVELFDGDIVSFTIPEAPEPEDRVRTRFFVDVPEGTRSMLVTLDDGGAGRDIDVSVPDPDLRRMRVWGYFGSTSASGHEYVHVQDFATAVEGRRRDIVVTGYTGAAIDATLSIELTDDPPPPAEFVVEFDNPNPTGAEDCNVAPWSDDAAHNPVGGNPALTAGEARRNAMLHAVALLSGELTSRIPIRIRACWREFGPTDDGSIALAVGRSINFWSDMPALPWDRGYSQAAAIRLAGTDMCNITSNSRCADPEVLIWFNERATDHFYYGLQPESPAQGSDFVSVAMHEITHGLGFSSLIDAQGALASFGGRTYSDAFVHQLATLRDGLVPVRLDDPSLTDADRTAAISSTDKLLWFDDQANIQEQNSLLVDQAGLIRMETILQYEDRFALAHVSDEYCDLMSPSLGLCQEEAIRSFGVSRRMLDALGWADGPTRPPYLGLMFDRRHPGHGFELQAAGTNDDGQTVYVLTFYSYETSGALPEWFQAIGTVQNGAFVGQRNADSNGFPRYLYDVENTPPQTADPDTFSQVALSFNNVANSAACNDGVDRSGAEPLASFQWAIGQHSGEWCAEPLVPQSARPDPADDFGGLWFSTTEDQGWGFSLENIVQADGSIDLFVLLYVYAADGTPVWFFGQASGFTQGVPTTIALFQRKAYARTRGSLPVTDSEAGSITLTLNGLTAENFATVDVDYLGREGGSWIRDNVPINRLSVAR